MTWKCLCVREEAGIGFVSFASLMKPMGVPASCNHTGTAVGSTAVHQSGKGLPAVGVRRADMGVAMACSNIGSSFLFRHVA